MGNAWSCCGRSPSTNENEDENATTPTQGEELPQHPCSSSTNENENAITQPQAEIMNLSTSTVENENENAITLPQVKSMNLDELISFIEERLNKVSTHKGEESTFGGDATSTSVGVSSSISYGSDFLQNVLNRVKKHASQIYNPDMRKTVIDILKGASQIHWVTAGIGVVAYVLDQIDQVSTNKTDCNQLLRYMCALAKHVKQLVDRLPQEKLTDVVVFIINAAFFCVSRMDSGNLSKFFFASVDKEEIERLRSQLAHKYSELMMDSLIQILNSMPTPLPPSQGEYSDAVGIDDARNKVTELLDLKDESPRTVVIYGIGGIGKTTLAADVFKCLPLQAYKFCRVDIDQDCKENDLKKLQQQILLDLFGKNNELRSCHEGREQLSMAFKSSTTQPLFLFIDNALRGSDLVKFLPRDLSYLPKHSRILVTTRRLDQTDMLQQQKVQRYPYPVDYLSSIDAKELLCKKASTSANAAFEDNSNINRVVEMCGGVPLILDMVGSKLSSLLKHYMLKGGGSLNERVIASACNDIIEFLKESLQKGEGELSEKVVDWVYSTLDATYKEAFLDIAFFFNNKERRIVACVVGEIPFQALEGAALVKTSQEGIVIVHDIVRERGRRLSGSDRITDVESFEDALEDPQKLEKMKGIRLEDERFELKAEHLDKMHKSLRVLHLRFGPEVTGLCTRRFENLRYLSMRNSRSPMKLSKLPGLAFFESGIRSDDNFCQIPHSLRILKVYPVGSLGLPESFGNLSLLDELDLRNGKLKSFPESFGQLKSLRQLRLFRFNELTCLPESFGNLCSLEEFDLINCDSLQCLPASFVQLKCLHRLRISDCYSLTKLPSGFENITSSRDIRIVDCHQLESLPAEFGQLKYLEWLVLKGFDVLTNLPHTIGQLSSLKKLYVKDCSMLCCLPESFGQLQSLEHLNMSGCRSLQTLNDDFGLLPRVVGIDASQCPALDGKAMDKMMELKSLMMLNIKGSPLLIKRWEEIKERHPLLVGEVRWKPWAPVSERPEMLAMYRHVLSTALFGTESRLMNIDGQLARWSDSTLPVGQVKVAVLFTMLHLCSPSNGKVSGMVKQKIASEGLCTIYVGLMPEQSKDGISETLVHLCSGTTAPVFAWIPPHSKWKQLLGYSVCALLSPSYDGVWERQLVNGVHTFICSANASVGEGGERRVEHLNMTFPVEKGEEGAVTDFGGSFTTLFSDLTDTFYDTFFSLI